ncbi:MULTISPECIES: GGDEF domain-containing phosphodiesterase [Sulfurimonas]|uniref:sensor domain-containing protein n=1 Tax=Sulfurimonas TaxID=202746 RepID=UPI0012654D69|nr:GGDEF domain-containing phosphodiesterase [Sulfurimonas indica]
MYKMSATLLYPIIAILLLCISMIGFFKYAVSESQEAILESYMQKAKEESYLLKTLIEELSLNQKQTAIQKGLLQLSSQANTKYVLLVAPDKTILYASEQKTINKKLKEIFSHKRLQHYEDEINTINDLHIHIWGKTIDATIKVDPLYNSLHNKLEYGYIIMLYDLNDLIAEREKNIFQELFSIFMLLLFIIILLFYFYYKNFLLKLYKIYDIASAFTKKKTPKNSMCINDLIEKIVQITQEFEVMSRVIEYSSDAILITDENKNIIFINPAFENISKFTKDEVIGKKPEDVIKSDLMSDDYYTDMWYKLATYGKFQGKIIDRKHDGTDYVVWQKIWALKDPQTDKITNYVALSQDISDLITQQKEIEHLAYYDGLTGLSNRSYFINILNKFIKKRKKEKFALLFVDIDNFKEVNETIGYHAGDIILQNFSEYLQYNLRDEDIIARLGGDEFAILAYNITRPEDALEIGCKITDFSRKELIIDNHTINISISGGIALYPNDGKNSKELLAAVDIALSRSKQEGKNKCTIFQVDMQKEAVQKVLMKHELKSAIKNNEFELYYQPKFTVDGTKIDGFEALIRWNHPQKGFIQPGNFISIAEESGIIIDITAWIFREINRSCEAFSKISNNFRIAINISARHFEENNLIQQVQNHIDKKWVEGGYIEFEITESAIMKNIKDTIQQLVAIKAIGITISLDDYGTGHSSLAYLKNLPIDKIKIDKSFIDEICTNKKDYLIVKATIELAENLGMHTIIEGVEDKEQLQLLQKFGATYIQGYIYSKPLTQHDALELLQAHINN